MLTSATLSIGGDFSHFMHQTGIDLPGDILSSLVVIRLPFPTPNPVSEYERTLHDDFYSYLSERIVPDMLIKLRQWIGRGIRRSLTDLTMWGGSFCPIRKRAILTPESVVSIGQTEILIS